MCNGTCKDSRGVPTNRQKPIIGRALARNMAPEGARIGIRGNNLASNREEEGSSMRSRTTRRDFLWMLGAAAGVAVGATLPGILGGRLAVSAGLAVPAGAADQSAPAQIRVYSVEKGNYV